MAAGGSMPGDAGNAAGSDGAMPTPSLAARRAGSLSQSNIVKPSTRRATKAVSRAKIVIAGDRAARQPTRHQRFVDREFCGELPA